MVTYEIRTKETLQGWTWLILVSHPESQAVHFHNVPYMGSDCAWIGQDYEYAEYCESARHAWDAALSWLTNNPHPGRRGAVLPYISA